MYDPEQQLNYAKALLRDSALSWFKLRLQDQQFADQLSMATLAQGLSDQFEVESPETSARAKLKTLRQTGSAQSYAKTFQDIILDIPGMAEADRVDKFVSGLKPSTQLKVLLEDPKSLQAAIKIAIFTDKVSWSLQCHSGNPHIGSRRGANNGPARVNPFPRPRDPDVMDVDSLEQRSRLTPEERQQLFREGKCLYCRQAGHIKRNCPVRPQRREVAVVDLDNQVVNIHPNEEEE